MKKKVNNEENKFLYLAFCFFFVSIIAWLLEICYSLYFRNKLVTPGAYYGPYCPIYGATFVLIYLIVNKEDRVLDNALKIFVLVGVSEYLISFITDKFFHKMIWNYTRFPLNINGRVCLQMSLLFTVVGLLSCYFVEPYLKKTYLALGKKAKIVTILLTICFSIDFIYCVFIR